jgi:predicted aspartyl protease
MRNLVAGLFLALATQPAASESIPLQQVGGLYMVPVRINDAVSIPFIVDSGATDVVIPADVFSTLLRTGTVSRADFKGTAKATLADGSTMSSERYVLHKMVVDPRHHRLVGERVAG